ncbi:MAG TPA: TetR family transcriptional regulator [Pseudonocardia sp.]|jgi:AcrR family transcriptional regulator|nr:TetR family transcriptional regulator [Pseudonocardia sp.]
MTSVVRPYRGVSAEDRLTERRARLKEAGLDTIGEAGVAAVNVVAVCGRAGLSKRYFYESFSNRDALLHEAMDDFFTEVYAEILDAIGSHERTPEVRAHLIAGTLIDFLRRDARRARLYVESAGHPPLQSRREAAFELFTRLLVDAFPIESASPDSPEGAVLDRRRSLAALIVVAGTTQAATSWLQGRIELRKDDVVDEIAHAILAAFAPRRPGI